jgi:hypothetical protein
VLRTGLRILLCFVLFIVICAVSGSCAPKEAEMGFKVFQDFDLEQLRTLQVKLTYVGAQKKPIPTVAFTSSFNTVDMEKFKPFRRSGFHYGNDDLPNIWTFTCSPEELKGMIDAVGEIEAVRQGEVIGEFLSFMMYNTTPEGDKAFEAILDAETSKLLLSKIRAALDTGNTEGIETLDGLAQILF